MDAAAKQCQESLSAIFGKRNKHGIPLRKLWIFGKTGLQEVRDWQKKQLR